MTSASSSGSDPEPPRVRLARLAREASLAVEDVVGADRAAAFAEGETRYGVTLHLTTRLVPLPPLAEQVRARVREAAAAAGLTEALGSVDVTIDGVEGSS